MRPDSAALSTTRVALGFLLAPAAGVFVWSLFVCLGGPGGPGRFADCMGNEFLLLLWFSLFCAYPPTLLLGVPLFFVLKRHNRLRPVPLALASLVFSVAATALFFALEGKFSAEGIGLSIPFAIRTGIVWAGAIAGLAFWAVAVFRNSALSRV
jgi:hypothetical protein